MWLLPHAAQMCELLGLLADAVALDLLDHLPYQAEADALAPLPRRPPLV